jgi:AraC family transcriptional regulator
MWQERSWTKREDCKMQFRPLRSSVERHWSGFEATIYEASAGSSELMFSRHNVSMQLGAPLLVSSACDGLSERRLQTPGDLKIVPAGSPRVWETESATTKLSMEISPALLHSTARAMGIRNPDGIAVCAQLHLNDPRIEHLGWAVKAELESGNPLGRLYGESLGLALSAQLLRYYARVPQMRPVDALSQRRFARIVDYIRANPAADLSLFELSGMVGLSASHFKTSFKLATGMPVHQYVLRARVEFAAGILQRDDAPLADVALQAGFANQSHLARCMRRFMGVTPGRIRAASDARNAP